MLKKLGSCSSCTQGRSCLRIQNFAAFLVYHLYTCHLDICSYYLINIFGYFSGSISWQLLINFKTPSYLLEISGLLIFRWDKIPNVQKWPFLVSLSWYCLNINNRIILSKCSWLNIVWCISIFSWICFSFNIHQIFVWTLTINIYLIHNTDLEQCWYLAKLILW